MSAEPFLSVASHASTGVKCKRKTFVTKEKYRWDIRIVDFGF
jgi:hypothetical protein